MLLLLRNGMFEKVVERCDDFMDESVLFACVLLLLGLFLWEKCWVRLLELFLVGGEVVEGWR